MKRCPACRAELPEGWAREKPPHYYRCSCGEHVKQRLINEWIILAGAMGIFVGLMENASTDIERWFVIPVLFVCLLVATVWVSDQPVVIKHLSPKKRQEPAN